MRPLLIILFLIGAGAVGYLIFSGESQSTPLSGTGVPGAINQTANNVLPESKETKKIAERPVASKTGPWPTVFVPKHEHRFGRMTIGQSGEYDFVIRNDGEADLELVAGEPSCQCTGFALDRTTVPPGEEATLTVSWKGKQRDPTFTHGGPVYTNDPEYPEVSFRISGSVDMAFEILPSGARDAGSVSELKPGLISGAIVSHVYQHLTLESMESSSELIKPTIHPFTNAELAKDGVQSGQRLDVEIEPSSIAGTLNEQITLKFEELDGPLFIDIVGYREGPVRLFPTAGTKWEQNQGRTRMGSFAASKGRKVSFLVIVEKESLEGDLELTSVESEPKYLRATLEKVNPEVVGGPYNLNIEVPPRSPRADYRGDDAATLRIETNHPRLPILEMSVEFTSF